ncbi:ABC transporter substrate-binding protein [Arthrobacter sp. NQ7]|uniref:ABC transporter substrate-binding protein n=1 Tax=Arthrobacter sp. NQ7 TaxID=3032303 RepID=UPI0024BB6FB2|nr:ABC transporter substrate-binding protein [Arthrobacter sp. NQ7]
MKTKHLARAAAIAVAATFALTACSGPSGTSGSSGQEAPHTLRLALAAPPSNFQVGAWSGGDATLLLSTYDTIVHRSVDGKLVPAIAESWQYSDNRTQLTLKIRSGMKFTSGNPVDAKAVVASLEAARVGPSTKQNVASVSKVEATDESTVVVSLSSPDAALLPYLSGAVVGDPNSLTAEDSKLWPVGSGPYILSKEKSTVGSHYVLDKNPGYWNAGAYPYETVDVQIIQDPTAGQNAVLSGQLDYAGLPSKDAQSQFPQDRFTVGQGKPSTVSALWLVDREGKIVPALKDVRVRRAINMSVNRDAIAANLNPGTNTATNQLFSREGSAFSQDLEKKTPYDVTQAKKLMAEAGYSDGFDVTMPSVPGITTAYESAVQQSLADIGVRVTWEPVPFQQFYQKVFGGSYGMFFMFNGFSGSDAQDFNASNSGIFNPFNLTTPELEKLKAAANAAPEAGQAEAFRAINEYLVDQAWAAPVSNIASFYVVPKTVEFTAPVQFGQGVEPFKPAGNQ